MFRLIYYLWTKNYFNISLSVSYNNNKNKNALTEHFSFFKNHASSKVELKVCAVTSICGCLDYDDDVVLQLLFTYKYTIRLVCRSLSKPDICVKEWRNFFISSSLIHTHNYYIYILNFHVGHLTCFLYRKKNNFFNFCFGWVISQWFRTWKILRRWWIFRINEIFSSSDFGWGKLAPFKNLLMRSNCEIAKLFKVVSKNSLDYIVDC